MESQPREILIFETADGRQPFPDWMETLVDNPVYGVILTRLDRLEDGNLGDCRPVGEGVHELRIDWGPGYRVYFGEDGDLIILLGGGTKRTQSVISPQRKSAGGSSMPKRTASYSSWLSHKLSDPEIAANYLNAANRDSKAAFLKALRKVAEARQISKVAKGAGVSRESLYRMTSETGNPTYSSLRGILQAVGLNLRVEPTESAPRSRSRLTANR